MRATMTEAIELKIQADQGLDYMNPRADQQTRVPPRVTIGCDRVSLSDTVLDR
ncbi:hypothetical protein JCM19233_2725 [Vibrio astriarenae]|nr:hypothetical protein JCM19233_2725 [Vibrio sp. C7]